MLCVGKQVNERSKNSDTHIHNGAAADFHV